MTYFNRKAMRAGTAAVAAAAILFASGCGNDQGGPSTETVPGEATVDAGQGRGPLPSPSLKDVPADDPVALIVTMCETVFTRDAVTEMSYSDSYRRAKDLMAPKLAAELFKSSGPVRPFPQWVQWQRQQARVTGDCAVTNAEHPADTDASVSRVLAVTETVEPSSSSEESSQDQSWVVYATGTNDHGTWRVSQFTVQPN